MEIISTCLQTSPSNVLGDQGRLSTATIIQHNNTITFFPFPYKGSNIPVHKKTIQWCLSCQQDCTVSKQTHETDTQGYKHGRPCGCQQQQHCTFMFLSEHLCESKVFVSKFVFVILFPTVQRYVMYSAKGWAACTVSVCVRERGTDQGRFNQFEAFREVNLIPSSIATH